LWWTQQSVGCGEEWLQGQTGQDKCRNTPMYAWVLTAIPVRGCYIAIYHGIICNMAF